MGGGGGMGRGGGKKIYILCLFMFVKENKKGDCIRLLYGQFKAITVSRNILCVRVKFNQNEFEIN